MGYNKHLIETSASNIFFYLEARGIFGLIIILLGLRSIYLIIYLFFKGN